MPKPSYSRVHRFPSGDGWPLALYEYEPRGTNEKALAAPVFLVHGAFNRYNVYDLGEGRGLAPWLAARGFHVFSVDLRGRGRSLPRRMDQRLAAIFRKGWTLGDFLARDLPAAFDFILRRSGAGQLDYLGHSMGGMLAFLHLSRTRDERVRKVVSVGSADPRTLPRLFGPRERAEGRVNLLTLLAPLFETLPIVPAATIIRLALPFWERVPRLYRGAAFNPQNVEPEVAAWYLRKGMVDVSSRKFFAFQEMARGDGPGEAEVARFSHPVLLLSGERDALVPPAVVAETHRRLVNAPRKHVHFSRAGGHSADYGHSDLLIGKKCPQEVFPVIEEWLRN